MTVLHARKGGDHSPRGSRQLCWCGWKSDWTSGAAAHAALDRHIREEGQGEAAVAATPYYEDDYVTIYHGDCREVLPLLAPFAAGDVTISDPPYNVGFDYGTGGGLDARTGDSYAALLHAALGRTDTLVYFPGMVNLFAVPSILAPLGLSVRRVLGWHRKEFAGDKWSSGPAMSWEPIIWADTGQRRFNKRFGTFGRDFMVVDATHGDRERFRHPCPKPKRVMDWLVGLFAPERGVVLDPFMGSGTTLRAAKDLGLKAIGIDIEERYCEIAAQRCSQEVLGP